MQNLLSIELRRHLPAWAVTLLFPVPAIALAPEVGVDMALAYLGLGTALLAAEIFREPLSLRASETAAKQQLWCAKMIVLALAALISAIVLTVFGLAIDAQSNLPIGLLAVLSVTPALGGVPYLTARTGKPFLAIFLTACLLLPSKMTSCVIVRLVYGPDALADGYMAADWHTAKLMITFFWAFTVSISIMFFALFARSIFVNPHPVHIEPAINFPFVEINHPIKMKLTIIIIGVIAMLVGLGFVFPAVALWRNLGTLHDGNAGLLAFGSLLTLGGAGAAIAAFAKRKA